MNNNAHLCVKPPAWKTILTNLQRMIHVNKDGSHKCNTLTHLCVKPQAWKTILTNLQRMIHVNKDGIHKCNTLTYKFPLLKTLACLNNFTDEPNCKNLKQQFPHKIFSMRKFPNLWQEYDVKMQHKNNFHTKQFQCENFPIYSRNMIAFRKNLQKATWCMPFG